MDLVVVFILLMIKCSSCDHTMSEVGLQTT